MQVWRICGQKFAADAFSGEGPRLFSGRWNPKGVPMVYTSAHLSLAAMEVFVHLEIRTEPDDLMAVSAVLPVHEPTLLLQGEKLVKELPSNWRSLENAILQRIGANWVNTRTSLALMVPSAVIDSEWNVLINPQHPDAARIEIGKPKPFRFDPRMFHNRLS